MNIAQYTFNYDPSGLWAFSYAFTLEDPVVPGIMLCVILIYAFIYTYAPYIYGYITLHKKEQNKKNQRRVIQDLILMKEIQSELEKEMEQALLNAALQSKTSPVQA